MSWWLAHAERTLTEEVPAPPAEVRDFYVDLDNIRLVHPLIVSVELLSRTETLDGYQQSYQVVDRIPLGPFTMQISYRARLHVPTEGDVSTEADVVRPAQPDVHEAGATITLGGRSLVALRGLVADETSQG